MNASVKIDSTNQSLKGITKQSRALSSASLNFSSSQPQGLAQVSDDLALQVVIDKILAENPEEVASYRGGKEGLFGWFMGQVMRETRGKADPQLTRDLLQKALKGT